LTTSWFSLVNTRNAGGVPIWSSCKLLNRKTLAAQAPANCPYLGDSK
jgi:hypothetical protein